MGNCLVCQLNREKTYTVEETKYWQIDTPKDIHLDGLFFVKTKRHIESLASLNAHEQRELGGLLQKYGSMSKRRARAVRVITMCLGFKDPHVHFWVVPVTKAGYSQALQIASAVKAFADSYR